MNDYQQMRLSENEDDDAFEPDEIPKPEENFADRYAEFYDDVKLRNDTKLDW